jgi:putative transport protein
LSCNGGQKHRAWRRLPPGEGVQTDFTCGGARASCGPKFIATVGTAGPLLLLYGAITLLILVGVTAVCCLWIFKLPFDTSVGVICGATGNPAILAFANRIAPTDQPDIMYAMIFPSMTIVKVLFVQIAISIATG